MRKFGVDFLICGIVVLALGWSIINFVGEYHQTILALCGINVILAVSLNLVNGFTGQFSLGHAGFMAVGAYASAAITTLLFPNAGMEYLITDPLGMQIGFLIAIVVG